MKRATRGMVVHIRCFRGGLDTGGPRQFVDGWLETPRRFPGRGARARAHAICDVSVTYPTARSINRTENHPQRYFDGTSRSST